MVVAANTNCDYNLRTFCYFPHCEKLSLLTVLRLLMLALEEDLDISFFLPVEVLERFLLLLVLLLFDFLLLSLANIITNSAMNYSQFHFIREWVIFDIQQYKFMDPNRIGASVVLKYF